MSTIPPSQPEADYVASPPPTPPAPLAGNRFFAWMRSLGITREPGWIGGVSAGIALRLGIDALIVRGIIVVVAVLGGPALLLYAAAWLLLPDRDDKIHLEEVFRGRIESPIAGIGALVFLSVLPVTQGFWLAGSAYWGDPYWGQSVGRALWTVVLLGLLVWFVVWVARRSSRDQAAPTVTPATTDDRPETVPSAYPATSEAMAAATAVAAGTPASAAPGARPPAPSSTASAEEFAAWREQQAQWKAENDAFRARQASEQRAASLAAHEQYRREREARREVERARLARTRSNPLYSFVVIGLSLVAGGIVTLLLADGEFSPEALLAGLGSTLVVLALGIIINGARGKRGGGSLALAIIVLIPLLIAGALPKSPNISYLENARFVPTSDGGWTEDVYFVGVGDATIDLRDFYTRPMSSGRDAQVMSTIVLVVGSGDVTVLLPDDELVRYEAVAAAGSITGVTTDFATNRGAFASDSGEWNAPASTTAEPPARVIDLDIVVGAGNVRFEASASSTEGNNR
jgi:phage shock protein PspC (stress-responsive transcriptional regulator)